MVSRQLIDLGVPSLSLLKGKRIFGILFGRALKMDPKEVQKMKKTCEDNGIAVWLNDGCFLEVNPCLVPCQSQRPMQRVGHLCEVYLVPLLYRVQCRWHHEESLHGGEGEFNGNCWRSQGKEHGVLLL